MHLSAIHVYPIKSTAGLDVASAEVEARGLAGDRRWMLVDESGRFLTARRLPGLTRVRATPVGETWRVEADGRPPLILTRPTAGAPEREVVIWKDRLGAADGGDEAAEWFSSLIGLTCRIVYMADRHQRPVDPSYGRSGDTVSFADGYPLLVIGDASLADLNERLQRPVPMARFRPNLVMTGAPAFAEDRWRLIRVGEVPFEVVKPCARCVLTTVDPDTGTRDPDGEPLKTLTRFRRNASGAVIFGQNLVARGTGIVQHGDPIEVLESLG